MVAKISARTQLFLHNVNLNARRRLVYFLLFLSLSSLYRATVVRVLIGADAFSQQHTHTTSPPKKTIMSFQKPEKDFGEGPVR